MLGITMALAMIFFTARALKNADYTDVHLEGSLTEAIHRELLLEMPGICRDEFSVVDSVNGMSSGDVVNVHGTGARDFCIRIWHETINGRVRILDIEAKSEDAVSKLIQCKFAARKAFRKK